MKAPVTDPPVSDPQPIDVTGYLVPFTNAGQPCLLNIGQSLCMPLFSDIVALDEFSAAGRFTYDRLVQVNDAERFLREIPLFVRMIADPHVTEAGRLRYTEIWRGE